MEMKVTDKKFNVGDKVVVNCNEYPRLAPRGSTATVVSAAESTVLVNLDRNVGDQNVVDWMFEPHELTHQGQTLAELNVMPGDVVECVFKALGTSNIKDGGTYTVSDDMKINGSKCSSISLSKFLIVSRASDKWHICPHDYEQLDNHTVTYHMGVPVAYKVIEVPLVDVDRGVWFDGEDMWSLRTSNATLRGQTLNGKPVGQWVIDMDGE